jgi:hypothetical protein
VALQDNVFYCDFGNGSSTGYYAVPAWGASASKVCGNLVRQLAAPSVGNERVFVCVASTAGAGQTGGSEPSWTVTRGAKNTDNTVTWQECTGIAALNGDLANTPNWNAVKNTAVTLGQVIQNVAGTLILICTTAGTAGNGAEPSWAAFTNAGATTSDNTITWTTLGASFSHWAVPHARVNSALALNWAQAGNKVFVASEHAETQSSGINMTGRGLAGSPVRVICVGKTNVPPGQSDVTTGASISTTGASTIEFGFNGSEWVYFNGFTINAGSSSNNASIGLADGPDCNTKFENCTFVLNNTSSSSRINFSGAAGPNKVECVGCAFTFGAVTQGFSTAGNAGGLSLVRGGSIAASGSIPTDLFLTVGSGLTLLDAVDLSAVNTSIAVGSGQSGFLQLRDCKLNASVVIQDTGSTIFPYSFVDVVRSDSSGKTYRIERHTVLADETTETTVVRSGGATSSDGTSIARKIVTKSGATWDLPYEALPLQVNNIKTTSTTVTVYGIWGGGAVPTNDQVWMDVKYPGNAGNPLSTIISGTKSNILATGANQPSDTSSWGGSTTPFKMTATFTPALKGLLEIYVKVGAASQTVYIDPHPVVQ